MVRLGGLSPFYNGKKVFVTGHTGFKGSWLIACLQELGAKIKGYALPPDFADGLFGKIEKDVSIQSVYADIRERNKLKEEIIAFQPDLIFHLAAQPLVRLSYIIPAETFEVNVVGTANLLEAVKELKGPCAIVIITTDKVYENKEIDVLYKETDMLGGYDAYSSSKACTEIAVNSFRHSFFNLSDYAVHQKAISTARAGNVIGGGDWNRDRIIPDIINALKNKTEIIVRNPNAVRPWQHVLEPIIAYLLLGAKLGKNPVQFSKAYNFGPLPADHLTVKDLVEKAIKYWGSGAWKDDSGGKHPHEAGLLKLDISLAQKELGWMPKLSADKAIQWTIDWYKERDTQKSKYTFQQIHEYFSL